MKKTFVKPEMEMVDLRLETAIANDYPLCECDPKPQSCMNCGATWDYCCYDHKCGVGTVKVPCRCSELKGSALI